MSREKGRSFLPSQENRRPRARKSRRKKNPPATAVNRQAHRNRHALARQSPRKNLARESRQPHRRRRARRPSRALHRNQSGATRQLPNRKRRRRNLTRK